MSDTSALGPHTNLALPPPSNRWLHGLAQAELAPDLAASEIEVGPEDLSHHPKLMELLNRLPAACQRINQDFFRFDLTALGEPGEPTLHHLADLGDGALPCGITEAHFARKLVVAVPIGGVGGASLHLPATSKSTDLAAGVALVFPAFMSATLTGTAGCIGSLLVLHAIGPSFR